jgi:hypothetical protein
VPNRQSEGGRHPLPTRERIVGIQRRVGSLDRRQQAVRLKLGSPATVLPSPPIQDRAKEDMPINLRALGSAIVAMS